MNIITNKLIRKKINEKNHQLDNECQFVKYIFYMGHLCYSGSFLSVDASAIIGSSLFQYSLNLCTLCKRFMGPEKANLAMADLHPSRDGNVIALLCLVISIISVAIMGIWMLRHSYEQACLFHRFESKLLASDKHYTVHSFITVPESSAKGKDCNINWNINALRIR